MRGMIIPDGCAHCSGDLMYVDGPHIQGKKVTELYSCIECRVHTDVEVSDDGPQ